MHTCSYTTLAAALCLAPVPCIEHLDDHDIRRRVNLHRLVPRLLLLVACTTRTAHTQLAAVAGDEPEKTKRHNVRNADEYARV